MRKLVVPPARKAWGKLTTKLRFKLRRKQQPHHLLLGHNGKRKKNVSTSHKSSSGSKHRFLFMNHIKRTAGALSSVLFFRRGSRRPRINPHTTSITSTSSPLLQQPRNANSMPALRVDDMFHCNNHEQQQCQWVPPPALAEAAELLDQHGVRKDKETPALASAAATTAVLRGIADDDWKKQVEEEEEEAKMEEESDEDLLLDHQGQRPLAGVDLRAEMFISSFREEMRLQRQRSLTEYQERLDRSI